MRFAFIALISGYFNFASAQKTVTLAQCEATFLKNNLLLLAGHYNIDASRAAVIQAGIWETPYLYGEFNAINPQQNKTLDVGHSGEKLLTVQQLIYLGGKKKKEVELANSNVAVAEYQFQQLLLNLKQQLYNSFFGIFFDQQILNSVNNQIGNLDSLTGSYEEQTNKGNIPLKELVRLQSLVMSVKNERISLRRQLLEEQETMKLLTGWTEEIVPSVEQEFVNVLYTKTPVLSKDSLSNLTLTNNPEYLTALQIVVADESNLRWQKSLATPDLTLGTGYDQRGGAFVNQMNITFGIPLTFWNRNRGNIMIAEDQVKIAKAQSDYKATELRARLSTSFDHWSFLHEQYKDFTDKKTENLQLIYNSMLQNFRKQNISLLEFTDFMESYNQSVYTLNDIRKQFVISCFDINFLTNSNIF